MPDRLSRHAGAVRNAELGLPIRPVRRGSRNEFVPKENPLSNQEIEASSGKGAADENFPVGSVLIARHLRPHVAIYYAFARACDDIADDPDLAPDDKVDRLDAMDSALNGTDVQPGTEKATALRNSLLARNIPLERGSDLLRAFRQDAQKATYETWGDLIRYCEMSANPVGQYLLDLHGEDRAGFMQSDALCTVLQILNHLQDCGEDRRELDRVYIPASWLSEQQLDLSALDAPSLSPGLRIVIDRMLEECNRLLKIAEQLPSKLNDRRLAAESETIIRLAKRLSKRLGSGDPLAQRVALSKFDFLIAGLFGLKELIVHRRPTKR